MRSTVCRLSLGAARGSLPGHSGQSAGHGGGRRNPLPPTNDDTCRCAAIHAAFFFLKRAVKRLFSPRDLSVITEKNLNPNVDRVVSALLELKAAGSATRARNGMSVRIAFHGSKREGDNFETGVRIAVVEQDVFVGKLKVHPARRRGKVSFAHAVSAATELLLMHLSELAGRTETPVDMRLGILELSGRTSNLPVLNESTARAIEAVLAQQQRQDGGTCGIGIPFMRTPCSERSQTADKAIFTDWGLCCASSRRPEVESHAALGAHHSLTQDDLPSADSGLR